MLEAWSQTNNETPVWNILKLVTKNKEKRYLNNCSESRVDGLRTRYEISKCPTQLQGWCGQSAAWKRLSFDHLVQRLPEPFSSASSSKHFSYKDIYAFWVRGFFMHVRHVRNLQSWCPICGSVGYVTLAVSLCLHHFLFIILSFAIVLSIPLVKFSL